MKELWCLLALIGAGLACGGLWYVQGKPRPTVCHRCHGTDIGQWVDQMTREPLFFCYTCQALIDTE